MCRLVCDQEQRGVLPMTWTFWNVVYLCSNLLHLYLQLSRLDLLLFYWFTETYHHSHTPTLYHFFSVSFYPKQRAVSRESPAGMSHEEICTHASCCFQDWQALSNRGEWHVWQGFEYHLCRKASLASDAQPCSWRFMLIHSFILTLPHLIQPIKTYKSI